MLSFPNSSVFYRDLDRVYSEVVRGEGIYLYDRSGKQYIDGSGEPWLSTLATAAQKLRKRCRGKHRRWPTPMGVTSPPKFSSV